MNKQEFIEQLADKEHAGWAHWMKYLFSKCDIVDEGYEQHYIIPMDLVTRWQRQIETPYANLTEKEKQSDRDEVAKILPIIDKYLDNNK